MRKQVEIAIEVADVIIFLTDMKQGVTPDDLDIALMLKNHVNQLYLYVIKQIVLEKCLTKFMNSITWA